MTAEELRAIITYLRERATLGATGSEGTVTIAFPEPTADEMIRKGLNTEGVEQIRDAPWWEEMVADIVETPEYCDPDDSPEQVLDYARDVVTDYLRKRASVDEQ